MDLEPARMVGTWHLIETEVLVGELVSTAWQVVEEVQRWLVVKTRRESVW